MNKIDTLCNLHVEIVGVNLENLLFDLTCAGVSLKHIKKHKKSLRFVISGQNYQVLEKLACSYGQQIKIIKQTGTASIIKKLPYSIGSILAIIFSCFFVYFQTSTIASVNCKIVDRQNQVVEDQSKIEQISAYLQQIGIKVGKKYSGKLKNAENMVVANFDFVESCNIEKHGNVVSVVAKQAVIPAQETSTIVAPCAGIIESIETFSGKAVAKAGDMVKKGQVLVQKDGEIFPKAKITIKTWFVGTAFHNEHVQYVERTGKKQISKKLSLLGFQVFGHEKSKFENFEEETSSNVWNAVLPLIVETKTYYETKIVEKTQNFEDIEEQIKQKAQFEATKNAKSPINSITFSVVREGNMTKVDCFAETFVQILVS